MKPGDGWPEGRQQLVVKVSEVSPLFRDANETADIAKTARKSARLVIWVLGSRLMPACPGSREPPGWAAAQFPVEVGEGSSGGSLTTVQARLPLGATRCAVPAEVRPGWRAAGGRSSSSHQAFIVVLTDAEADIVSHAEI